MLKKLFRLCFSSDDVGEGRDMSVRNSRSDGIQTNVCEMIMAFVLS